MGNEIRKLIFWALIDRKRYTSYSINRRIGKCNISKINAELELMLKEKMVKKIELMKGNMPITEWTLTKHSSFKNKLNASRMKALSDYIDLNLKTENIKRFLDSGKDEIKIKSSVGNVYNNLRLDSDMEADLDSIKNFVPKKKKKELDKLLDLLTEQEKLTKLSINRND